METNQIVIAFQEGQRQGFLAGVIITVGIHVLYKTWNGSLTRHRRDRRN